eukprot:1336971-Pyramimonas_sp.AAC.2
MWYQGTVSKKRNNGLVGGNFHVPTWSSTCEWRNLNLYQGLSVCQNRLHAGLHLAQKRFL